jgi:hypothetical protein
MDPSEAAWIEGVERTLGVPGGIDDETKRVLLRMTKVTADATGVRYLAPITAYIVGVAAGRSDAAGERFDLPGAAESIGRLAEGWPTTEG